MKNVNQVNIAELIYPWDSFDQLLQVMHVYTSLKHYENHDLTIIAQCIQHVTQKVIQNEDLKNFIDKVQFNKSLYPINFIQNLETFDQSLNNFLNSKNYATKEFKTNRTACASCQQEFNLNSLSYSHKTAVVYYTSKPPETVFNTYLKCYHCKTDHYNCYYVNSLNQKFFYPECFNERFISFTNQTVFEKQIFDMFITSLHFQHTSFKSYCDSYNSLFTSKHIQRKELSRKKFTECWFYYNLLLYQHEFNDVTKYIAPIIEKIDTSLQSIRNGLFKNFVKKWSGDFHTSNCKHPNCSKILNTDGIWKTTRPKCGEEEIYLNSEEVKPIKTGCKLTPKPNSYYCDLHQVLEPVTNIYINNELHSYRIKSIIEASPFHRTRKLKKIHDSFYIENDLNKKTKKNFKLNDIAINSTHEQDNDEDNVLYLVESVEIFEDSFFWLKKKHSTRHL